MTAALDKRVIRVGTRGSLLATTQAETVRAAITAGNVNQAKGSFDGPQQASTLDANDQLRSAAEYQDLVIAWKSGAPIRLRDVAAMVDAPENTKLAAWANERPAVILNIQRQPGANTVEVVDRVPLPVRRALGDAGLGLEIALNGSGDATLLKRYRRPTPRLALGMALRGLASAAMDVSDGLLIDAARLADASGLAADLNSHAIPLSEAAAAAGRERVPEDVESETTFSGLSDAVVAACDGAGGPLDRRNIAGRDLVGGEAGRDAAVDVHPHAVGAAVELRAPQVHQFDHVAADSGGRRRLGHRRVSMPQQQRALQADAQ